MPSWFDGFEILLYFFPGFFVVLFGKKALVARGWLPGVERAANVVLKATLYAILFSMGWRLASDARVTASLGLLGFQALTYAALSVIASILASLVFVKLMPGKHPAANESYREKRAKAKEAGEQLDMKAFLANLKGPGLMLAVVVAGGLAAAFLNFQFNGLATAVPAGDLATLILKVMLVSVGISMACSDMSVLASIRQPVFLLLPVVTAAASILAGLGAAALWGHSMGDGAAVAGGFGWYSLSAVLIADAGKEVLGATAFLANLFRESLAILSIGFLQAAGKPLSGISAAGATSMDVCLPPIALSHGGVYTTPSVYHGFVLSMMVPLVVPLFLAFSV